MKGMTFTFVVLSGLCWLTACFPRRYVLFEIALPWDKALNYCRENDFNLASVHNSDELSRLVDVARKYYGGHVWIGLYDDIKSWKWSLKQEGYYGEGEAKFRKWDNSRPDNYGGFQTCAGMEPNGFWNDRPCTDRLMFVCYKGNEGMVAPSFILVKEVRTWIEAMLYCREHHTDLASVRNQTENELIKTVAEGETVWLGLFRNSWMWSDGSVYTYPNWNQNQPNGHIQTPCGIAHEGKWEDYPCETKLYFVCQSAPEKVRQRIMRVRITKKDPSVDLEEAAEAILQQFNQTLENHGLSKDMKLAWRKQPGGKIFNKETVEEKNKETKENSCKQK